MASKKKDFSAGVDALDKFFSGSETQREETIKIDRGDTQEEKRVKITTKEIPSQELPVKITTEETPSGKVAVKYVEKDDQEPQEAPQKVRKTKTQDQDQKGSEEPQKLKKKVFSFRAEVSEADSWRVWADASGIKVDELGERAIREYIKRHPLKGDQLQIYELKMSQKP